MRVLLSKRNMRDRVGGSHYTTCFSCDRGDSYALIRDVSNIQDSTCWDTEPPIHQIERTSSNTPHRNECHSHPDKDARKQSDLFVPTIWFRNIVYLNVRSEEHTSELQ